MSTTSWYGSPTCTTNTRRVEDETVKQLLADAQGSLCDVGLGLGARQREQPARCRYRRGERRHGDRLRSGHRVLDSHGAAGSRSRGVAFRRSQACRGCEVPAYHVHAHHGRLHQGNAFAVRDHRRCVRHPVRRPRHSQCRGAWRYHRRLEPHTYYRPVASAVPWRLSCRCSSAR